MEKSLRRAARLYEDFTGHEASEFETYTIPKHTVLLKIGECEGIMYETVRDGKREKYLHRFRKKSRPILAASSDGRNLYLIGGRYKFTDAGIVDQ